MSSMDKEAQNFLQTMLVKYIKLLITSEKRELQYFKEKLTSFLQNPVEMKAFLEKLEMINKDNKTTQGSETLNQVLTKLTDYFLKNEHYGQIFKIMLQLYRSTASLSIETKSEFEQQIRDFEIKNPDICLLLKTLAQSKDINVSKTVQNVHSLVKKMIDNATVDCLLYTSPSPRD